MLEGGGGGLELYATFVDNSWKAGLQISHRPGSHLSEAKRQGRTKHMFSFLRSIFSSNRRKARRYADGVRVVIETGERQFDGHMLDVSATGARISTHEALRVGSAFVVRAAWSNGCAHLSFVVKRAERRGQTWTYGVVPNPNYRLSRSLLNRYVGRWMPRSSAAFVA